MKNNTPNARKTIASFGNFSTCYLHSVIKIAARCTGQLRQEVLTRVWHVYRAETKSEFSQRLRRLREWSAEHLSGGVAEMVKKLCRRRAEFTPAYDCPQAARASNGVDRLLNHLDRLLYAACYGHSKPGSTRLAVRAMALQWNFHPYGNGLTVHLLLLPTPPRGDAVAFGYRPENVCLKRTFTSLTRCALRRTNRSLRDQSLRPQVKRCE